MTDAFIIEPLAASHVRTEFTCGVDALDRYFWHQAGQDVRRRVTSCFVARERRTGELAGYYTLSAGGVFLADMPASLVKRLPRYPSVPVGRLGRLAVGLAYRGRKLGAALLWDALDRAARSEVAVYALVVDAKDEPARNFYLHHGALNLTRSFAKLGGCNLAVPSMRGGGRGASTR
jgi:predicted GNAT family N-acyltransferase